ncbi:MAG TPA: hypothetical protein VHP31_06880 [Caproicibacter sp.]|nr:hypothetical protein [Caproicibacter sp.]
MENDDIPIIPDPKSVTPAVIPTIPAPIPISMPQPDAKAGTALKVVPRRINRDESKQ